MSEIERRHVYTRWSNGPTGHEGGEIVVESFCTGVPAYGVTEYMVAIELTMQEKHDRLTIRKARDLARALIAAADAAEGAIEESKRMRQR